MIPTYVEPFLGAGAVWLRLLDPRLTPPTAWMGGKRRFAAAILGLLGLREGCPVPAILGDACWWGEVWPICLDPVTGPAVCAWLRSWRDEDPRALWFRLRDAGPAADPVERAAGLLWLQARAASGVPVWWEGAKVVSMDGHGRGPYAAWQSKGANGGPGRLVAGARGDRDADSTVAGHKGRDSAGGGGIVDPGTVADRLDAVRGVLARDHRVPGPAAEGGSLDAIRAAAPSVTVVHGDALDLVADVAPQIGERGRYYLDPPYAGATGYPATCPRDRVLQIAEEAARHGGAVVLSEAVPLDRELGAGWSSACLRAGRKPEWVTTYRCDVGAAIGPLSAREVAA